MTTIGLSGCGAIGRRHAANLAQRGARLLLYNRTRARAEAFAEEFSGQVCARFEELVEGSDAVVLATPPSMHAAQAVTALESGKPTLVEKPLCMTAEELTRIEAAAGAAADGAFVMIAENYYYKPSQALMREVIAWDGIGAVQSMQVKKLTQQSAEGWKADCGALLEGGIHFVAMVADLADAALARRQEPAPVRAPEEVTAQFPTAGGGAAERRCRLQLRYADGPEVHLLYAWDVPSLTRGTFQHSRIHGAEGRILFESNGIYVHVRGPGRKGLTFPNLADLMGYGAMTDDFLGCVATPGSAPYSNLARARRDLDIIWQAYRHLP